MAAAQCQSHDFEFEYFPIICREIPDFIEIFQPCRVLHKNTCELLYLAIFFMDKGKAVPLQVWSGPEGSRNLLPDFMITAEDGGKVVSLTYRSPLPPGNTHGTHFC